MAALYQRFFASRPLQAGIEQDGLLADGLPLDAKMGCQVLQGALPELILGLGGNAQPDRDLEQGIAGPQERLDLGDGGAVRHRAR